MCHASQRAYGPSHKLLSIALIPHTEQVNEPQEHLRLFSSVSGPHHVEPSSFSPPQTTSPRESHLWSVGGPHRKTVVIPQSPLPQEQLRRVVLAVAFYCAPEFFLRHMPCMCSFRRVRRSKSTCRSFGILSARFSCPHCSFFSLLYLGSSRFFGFQVCRCLSEKSSQRVNVFLV